MIAVQVNYSDLLHINFVIKTVRSFVGSSPLSREFKTVISTTLNNRSIAHIYSRLIQIANIFRIGYGIRDTFRQFWMFTFLKLKNKT